MRMTQGALGFLCKRYAAVLKKCRLLNVFGSLAVAGMLVMGGAGVAGAAPVDFSTVASENGEYTVSVESDTAQNTLSVIGTDETGYSNTSLTKITVVTGGQLEVLGGQRIVHRSGTENGSGMEFVVDGGNVDVALGSSNLSSIDVNTFTLNSGYVSIDGSGSGEAYIGGFDGFFVNDGTIELVEGGRIFAASPGGMVLNGGEIIMGNNTSIWFSGESGNDAINGTNITVSGTDATIQLGQNVDMAAGSITVADGQSLKFMPTNDDGGNAYPAVNLNQTGGVITAEGTVNLAKTTMNLGEGGTVEVKGNGRVFGGATEGHLNMTGGTLNIDGTNNSSSGGDGKETSFDVKTATISGGEVNITGSTETGSAYLGAYESLTVSGGKVNLQEGASIWSGSGGDPEKGLNLSGGEITMGNNTLIEFAGASTKGLTGATVTVEGTNAVMKLGDNTSMTDGLVDVQENATLTFGSTIAGTPDAPGAAYSPVNLNQSGGTISTAGTLNLAANSNLNVGDGATLQTVGTGYVNTDPNSTVTVAKGGTLNASAESAKITTDGSDYGAIRGAGTATLEDGANVSISGAKDGEEYSLLGTSLANAADPDAIGDVNVQSTSAALGMEYDATSGTFKAKAQSASALLPNLDGELGALAYNMAKTSPDGNDVMSSQAGRRFLARAIDQNYGGSVENRTATVESAARIAAVSAVPQMTWAAQKAASAAVTQRTSLSAPASAGLQAVAADGSVQTGAAAGDAMKNGFAMWIMPLYQSWNAWGLEGGNLDMDVHGGLGGLAVGADYTFDHAFRAGITVNMGGGYAEGSGDFNKTTNNFTFWGLGAYLGWSKNNFGLTADINHTWVYNDVEQDLAASMQMDSLKSDITSRALSAGLRGEYKLETDALDITPHVGVRYTYLTTDKYDVESGNATVLEGDTIHQGIWTFPIGVAFSKDVQMDSGWYVKPALDVAVIPAAGDIKARGDVRFTGVPGSAEMSTQTMDYITYMGQAGLEFGNDNVKLGVNYNLQMGAQSTAHGVFGTLRYEF